MYKLIGGDGKEYGPVSAEQLRQWVREHRANAQSLVQAVGSGAWQPLGQIPEFADLFAAGGVAPPLAPPSSVPHPYRLDLGGCLSRGWTLFQQNMGLCIAVWVIYFAISLGIGLLGVIPLVNILSNVAQIILAGPLLGGLYWVYLQRARNLPAAVGDLFAGFRRAFGNLILVQLIPTLLCVALVVPGLAVLLLGVIFHAHSMHDLGWSNVAGPALAVGIGLIALGFLATIYLMVCWLFAPPLVVDRQIGFWEAMRYSRAQVRQRWWGVFGSVLVLVLVAAAGTLACGIGLLLTIPWAFAALVYLYEDIFGRTAQAA